MGWARWCWALLWVEWVFGWDWEKTLDAAAAVVVEGVEGCERLVHGGCNVGSKPRRAWWEGADVTREQEAVAVGVAEEVVAVEAK